MILASLLKKNKKFNGESYNFGPLSEQNKKVIELVNSLSEFFPSSKTNILDQNNLKIESKLLKLNCDKALSDLGWMPTLNFKQTIELTSRWYKVYLDSPSLIKKTSLDQIEIFTELSKV